MLKEFTNFIKEYKVIGPALAFIMGGASNSLVKSLVDNIFMPLVNPLLVGEDWQSAVFILGEIEIRWGAFLAEFLHFTILAFIVFLVAKKILKEEKVSRK